MTAVVPTGDKGPDELDELGRRGEVGLVQGLTLNNYDPHLNQVQP
jgi:hypothetical protein